jgi:GPH family glycoside/pentoside/hexuronide:cation symporter
MSTPEKKTAPAHVVSYPRKIAWGLGGLTNDMVNALWVLAMPIFSVGLGVSAAWIGLALALPRVWDAISDPLMGHISDNTRSRYGRRRPYIFFGAIGLGVSFALIWMPSPEWSETMLLTWFIGTSLLFFTFLTIWNIPWTALGLELTPDVKERNGVQAVRSWLASGAAFIIPSIMPLAFRFGNGDEVEGVRTLGWIIGGVMTVCAITAALFCREPSASTTVAAKAPPKISFWKSAKYTFKDSRFIGLCIYASLFCGGILLVGQMGYYINVFYVYGALPIQEAKEAATHVMFWGGIVGGLSNLAAVPLIVWTANRLGKKPTLLIGVLIVAIGQLIKWFFFVPEDPYLQVWLSIIIYPGIILTWTLIPSMMADICDFDELETGHRREGMYSATFAWLLKVGVTIAMALSGWLINVAGIVDVADVQTPDAIFNMRLLFTLLPTIFVMIGGYFILRYPITEKDAERVKEQLAERHAAAAEAEV